MLPKVTFSSYCLVNRAMNEVFLLGYNAANFTWGNSALGLGWNFTWGNIVSTNNFLCACYVFDCSYNCFLW